jgi:hypothetical protein
MFPPNSAGYDKLCQFTVPTGASSPIRLLDPELASSIADLFIDIKEENTAPQNAGMPNVYNNSVNGMG